MGTQKNPKHMLKIMGEKIFTISPFFFFFFFLFFFFFFFFFLKPMAMHPHVMHPHVLGIFFHILHLVFSYLPVSSHLNL